MKQTQLCQEKHYFETQTIGKILLKIVPPVMAAQLIQALYNIVDSYFIGSYSDEALTALSVIYPVQLIITAIAIGTGVGVNTLMARQLALGRKSDADKTAGTGIILSLISWAVFALLSIAFLRFYVNAGANSSLAAKEALRYGYIICIGSPAIFLESILSKTHQARGEMRLPMLAQIAGALINIILDPLLIFGISFFPRLGAAGAAAATVAGQTAACIIVGVTGMRKPPEKKDISGYVKKIYTLGYPSVLLQLLYTVYIMIFNLILAGFSDSATTVLGLYYKLQAFFFIPVLGLQSCIVPVLSYNYAQQRYERCRKIIRCSIFTALSLMLIGVAGFEIIPVQLIRLFSDNDEVISIGRKAFRIIGLSFIPDVPAMIYPAYFQAIGSAKKSVLLIIVRHLVCLIPIFWLMSFIGLDFVWIAFPAAESVTGTLGIFLYKKQCDSDAANIRN
ncbi:MAG: MATE family efflux transporter [Oscillospiraceae bacterium]|nr:MATE family efflux transporter [Oscillospiraceae bacterium]